VYPDFVIYQQPFSSTELHVSSQIAISIRVEWITLPFSDGKGKENGHAQAYAPNGALQPHTLDIKPAHDENR